KNKPIAVDRPAKTETILHARRGTLKNLRVIIAAHIKEGCFPSVSEIKRQLASCAAICAHLIYMASSVKRGRLKILSKRRQRYKTSRAIGVSKNKRLFRAILIVFFDYNEYSTMNKG